MLDASSVFDSSNVLSASFDAEFNASLSLNDSFHASEHQAPPSTTSTVGVLDFLGSNLLSGESTVTNNALDIDLDRFSAGILM